MSEEKVIFDDCEHTLQLSKVNLIFNQTFKESVYPERLMITPQLTLEWYSNLKEFDEYTVKIFKFVVEDFPYEVTKENLDKSSTCFKHLIGLFSMTFFLLKKGVKFGWKYPEANLHPKYQVKLGDVIILLTQDDFLQEFFEKTK